MKRRLVLLLAATLLACESCKAEGTEPFVRVRGEAPAALQQDGAVLVSFWGSWCPPCVEETEGLAALAADPPGDLRVIVVAVNEEADAARRAFPGVQVIPDPRGTLAGESRADQLPVALLVHGGETIARFDGKRDWNGAAARSTLERLLGIE
ncbi:TlpA family protein disulfide reductase [Vulgatibacter sp.]|uniref:TlpA family protein disulfide reductase n=1 Tax=Vulgatibacter sp. TaxID=1971226 RepID=UPI00356623B0